MKVPPWYICRALRGPALKTRTFRQDVPVWSGPESHNPRVEQILFTESLLQGFLPLWQARNVFREEHTMHSSSSGKAVDGHYPLYEARWEHDACGTGFLADVKGQASHQIIEQAMTVLANLTHRGAQDAGADTNDGAGLMTEIPRALLYAELLEKRIELANPADLAAGMLFLPSASTAPAAHTGARVIVEETLAQLHLPLLLWRRPPLDMAVPGKGALATMPEIYQVIMVRPA